MDVVSKTLDSLPCKIYVISDLHLFSRYFSRQKFLNLVNQISKEDNSKWIFLGDVAEFITAFDPRFRGRAASREMKVNELDYVVNLVGEEIKKLFGPIKEKGLVWLRGNHEEEWEKRTGFDTLRLVKEILSIDTLDYYGILSLHRNHLRRLNFYLHHGYGSGRTAGAKWNRITSLMSHIWNVDFYIMGHTHNVGVEKKVVYDMRRTGKLDTRNVYLIHAGCYMAEARYAMIKMYPPMTVGTPIISLWSAHDQKWGIKVTV